ncbi:class I SAM-dependent methyltransferase [Ralstonia pseudosolanacearum]|uniref:class I SAM-dependent methyltransferase n=1 Tax=Ralstonia pseudosolanacearum TaxID=1310165 RepID=UPI0018D049A7|nr:class I SAM-dependent methyltransferase [Ralstonia pseudosolanacearum]
MSKTVSLPLPSEAAQAQSDRLLSTIVRAIEAAGGWLPFERYMELALYAPGLGYYSGGAAKFGRRVEDGGDFITAPELTPFFGRTVAHQIAQVLQTLPPGQRHVLEFGAGTGRLAADILTELETLGMRPDSYGIVELSGELRERQQQALASLGPDLAGLARWHDALPARFTGVMVGNEVLDAMPVSLWARRGGVWHRRGVAFDAGQGLRWSERAADPAEVPPKLAALPGHDDFITEAHEAAEGFIRSAGAALERGLLLLIDYGFPAGEYYHAHRANGTLMCHYRQHAHDDPFWLPGLQDITAHVDFSGIARAARETGLEVLGYASQARFLLGAGVGQLLMTLDPADPVCFLPAANAVQKLLSEAEMGELFKAIALGRGLDAALPLAGFADADRSDRLG